MPRPGLNAILSKVESTQDGVVLIPFGFTINGVTDPDGILGDLVDTVVRSEAGEFLVTLKRQPARVYYAHAEVSTTADDVDIYGKVDWSSTESAGTFVVRCMTGAVQTDPTDNTLVGGFILASRTTRSGR